MARLPIPGSDDGSWGDILNAYLLQSLTADGSIRTGVVGSPQLADGAVSTPKLADTAVTSAKLAPSAVTSSHLSTGSVTNSAITDGAIAQSKIANLSGDLAGKASTTHTHSIADTTNLQTTLDSKADSVHTHTVSQLSDATTAGRTLITAADATAQRTALGLGSAATLTVGTTAGTVAAGDDSRLTGALQASGLDVATAGLVGNGGSATMSSLSSTFARAVNLSSVATPDGACDVNTATIAAASSTLTLSGWATRFAADHVGKPISIEGAGAPTTTTLSAGISNGAQFTTISVAALGAAVPAGNLTIAEGGNSLTVFHGPAAAGATSIKTVRTASNAAYTTAASVTIAQPLHTTVSTCVSSTQVTLAAAAATSVSGVGFVVGTDNTSAIQAAINAAGRTPIIVDGYFITGPLTIPPNTTLIGNAPDGLYPINYAARASGLGLKPGANGSVIASGAGAQFVTIKNLRVDGNGWAQTVAAPAIEAPDFNTSREIHWVIDSVFVGWASGDGIHIGNNTRGTQVVNTYVYRCAGNGIRVDGTDNVIDRCFTGANVENGVRGAGPANTVLGLNTWGNLSGVYVGGTNSWQISTSYVDANRYAGIHIPDSLSVAITGNRFTPNAAAGTGAASNIMLTGTTADVLIGDNLHYSPTPGGWGYLPLYAVDAGSGTSWIDGGGNHVGDRAVSVSGAGGSGTRAYTATVQASLDAKADAAIVEAELLTSGQETFPRYLAAGNTVSTTGILYLAFFTARKSETVSKILTTISNVAASATPTLCRVGLYTVAGNGDLTLVASSTNDTALWTGSTFAEHEKTLSASYAVVKGSRYAIGRLCVTAGTAPNFASATTNVPSSTVARSPRSAGQVNGQSDLPSSITAATLAGNGAGTRFWGAIIP